MEFDALLFDLDGTLIDFDFQLFIKAYLGAASRFFVDLIPNPEMFIKELLSSTDVMERADNEETTALDDFLLDQHGHLIVKHDLFNHDGLTKDGIAEAFAEFAKKERLSFF